MGDVADQIINGEVCQLCCCGDGDARGYPYTCEECDYPSDTIKPVAENKPSIMMNKYNCPICNKRIKKIGIFNHLDTCHSELAQAAFTAAHKALLKALED